MSLYSINTTKYYYILNIVYIIIMEKYYKKKSYSLKSHLFEVNYLFQVKFIDGKMDEVL